MSSTSRNYHYENSYTTVSKRKFFKNGTVMFKLQLKVSKKKKKEGDNKTLKSADIKIPRSNENKIFFCSFSENFDFIPVLYVLNSKKL